MEGNNHNPPDGAGGSDSLDALKLLALEANINPVIITDMDGVIKYVNAGLLKLCDCGDSGEITGRRGKELLQDRAAVREVKHTLKTRGAWAGELHILRKDGSAVPVQVSASVIRDRGEPVGMTASFTDISGLKQAEEDLRRSEETAKTLLDATSDTAILIDNTGATLAINSMAAQRLGAPPEEIIGNPIVRYFENDPCAEHRQKYAWQVYQTGEPARFNEERAGIHYDSRMYPIKDSAGNVVRLAIFGQDITARVHAEQETRRLQDQLMQAQKMEAVGLLAGGVAHDFNNVLATIMSAAEIGINVSGPADPHFQRFQKIISACERARDLTMKLLTFARKEKVAMRPVSLPLLVMECTDMLRRTTPRTIQLKVDVDPRCTVNADSSQILQALLNICINACEAMPNGGVLSISAKLVDLSEPPWPGPGEFQPGPYCEIRIADTGHGIPENTLPRIFDPFFTSKPGGTGLGLSTTYGIVNSHGGCIRIRNRRRGGAEAVLFLPATSAETVTARPASVPKVRGNGRAVLIIDDEEDFREFLTEALDIAEFEVMSATNGREAIALFEQHHHRLAFVLLDVIMPLLDGADTLRRLKEIDPDVRVILCSGFSSDEQTRELMDRGAHTFLQKPFNMAELFTAIKQILD